MITCIIFGLADNEFHQITQTKTRTSIPLLRTNTNIKQWAPPSSQLDPLLIISNEWKPGPLVLKNASNTHIFDVNAPIFVSFFGPHAFMHYCIAISTNFRTMAEV
eukprot:gb/GEZJ01005992.1/.p1 GENE.gb/GEZJ01005992.1/~~gb/GEZJ01005992.1/.p1  ORF type:complete len:105 (-),score=2.67 gb/GEZJ01005992.1/:443-757(-)